MSNFLLKSLPAANRLRDRRLFAKPAYVLVLVTAFIYLCSGFAYAQQRNLSGSVYGEGNAPLVGVTVLLKGTTTATATDASGKFTIPVTGSNAVLVFSYIGYNTQEIAVGGQSTLSVALLPDAKALEEVVVVGYGSQRREDVTGAIATITEESFNRGQVTTPEQLITGRVAGVQVTSNGGAPGSGSQIRIRGGASLIASNDPLIVVDGVPLDNSTISGSPNPLSLINPNDIESFNILKDASATAIYGSRASNGVIIITTKKGAAGDKFKVNFNTLGSFYTLTKQIDVLTADEFREVVRREKGPTQQALLGNANTNWQDEIFRDAFAIDNNLVFSGSLKSVPYRVSLGYLDQQGTLRTSHLKRTSGALTLNPSFFNDHLRVNVNVRGTQSKSRFANEGAIGAAAAFDPTQSVTSDDPRFGGYFEYVNGNTVAILSPRNPVNTLENRRDMGEAFRSIGNLQLDYRFHFLPDLRANLNVGYDLTRSEGSTVSDSTLASVFRERGTRTQYEQSKDNYLVDFFLNYAKDLAAINSRIDATTGYSYQRFKTFSPSFPILSLRIRNLPSDTVTRANDFPTQNENVLIGFFGRVNYTFMGRYTLTSNLRLDGSSRFAPENRWGIFPSLAFAWNINEEEFMKRFSALSDLKLRLGYGRNGQQDLGNSFYPYLARYAASEPTAMYPLGDKFYNTLRPSAYDVNIKWEETDQFNIGLDFGFYNGKISGTVDFYLKKTKDLLGNIAPAAGTNLANQLVTNVGSLESKGVEVTLNFHPVSNANFDWNFGINGTLTDVIATNIKSVNVEGDQYGTVEGGTGNNVQIRSKGFNPYTFYVYKQVYDGAGNPLEGVFADLNNDGLINAEDRYRYKSFQAPVYLGFNNNISYKNLSLNFVLRANIGNYVYNNIYSNHGTFANISRTDFLSNMSRNVLETKFSDVTDRQLLSDYYVQNASFLRMDNLSLNYNFGKIAREKVALRLSATVQNAFVITNYKGLDPEIGDGIDYEPYPRARVFSLGANFDF